MRRKINLGSFVTGLAAPLILLGLPLTAGAATDREAEGSVIVLATHGTARGIGAGTVIDKSGTHIRVLTAAHVATAGTLRVRLEDGSEAPAQMVAAIPGRDLALIEADVTAAGAARLLPASLGQARSAEAVHVWGSGNDGPAYETATIETIGRDLPDGAPHGRYAIGCALCHKGDSGAGIFNARGEIVGVYIGYFEIGAGRVSVAESATTDVKVAARPVDGASGIAAPAQAQVAAIGGFRSR